MTVKAGQAIRNAVEAELAAGRFYTLLAEASGDEHAAAFLREMAEQERAHARAIEEQGAALAGVELAAKADVDVELIETLPTWKYVDGITLEQAFEVAISAEHSASLFYDALADHLDGDAPEFFRKLAKDEEQHAASLEQERRRVFLR